MRGKGEEREEEQDQETERSKTKRLGARGKRPRAGGKETRQDLRREAVAPADAIKGRWTELTALNRRQYVNAYLFHQVLLSIGQLLNFDRQTEQVRERAVNFGRLSG